MRLPRKREMTFDNWTAPLHSPPPLCLWCASVLHMSTTNLSTPKVGQDKEIHLNPSHPPPSPSLFLNLSGAFFHNDLVLGTFTNPLMCVYQHSQHLLLLLTLATNSTTDRTATRDPSPIKIIQPASCKARQAWEWSCICGCEHLTDEVQCCFSVNVSMGGMAGAAAAGWKRSCAVYGAGSLRQHNGPPAGSSSAMAMAMPPSGTFTSAPVATATLLILTTAR